MTEKQKVTVLRSDHLLNEVLGILQSAKNKKDRYVEIRSMYQSGKAANETSEH